MLIMNPCELFAARSRSHKIPARGQKDFYPDDSEEQKQRLQQRLDEHWSLISEERVERLGNLVKAVWSPSERIVELQTPAGKFWQTMGFSAEGKQFLLPEEALYLMECGNLQVFHQDLPLSIQDGYEAFLSSDSVSLQQYQVFGHLKRLGYVVHRFDPSKTAAASQAEEMEEEDKLPESHLVASAAPQTSSSGAAGEVQARTWWPAEVPERQAGQRSAPGSQRWDFSSICFPDLGSAGRLAPLDASLLPGGVTPGVCDVAPWMRRINLRKVKMSPKEEERERRQRRRDVNKDKEVQRCRNWAEYHKLLERRQAKRQGRPAHLWSGEVQPLHDPTRPISTGDTSTINSIFFLSFTFLSIIGSEEWRICFNVYQPDSVADFKKSNPGKPYARMCVCSFDGPVPDLRVIKQLSFQSGDVPVVYAAVDHGDISFYTFKDFQLPRDVYP
uniref:tRNA-splicing endonuclease subunit Sen54 N-terminal domain-containing protein n=1 Tax=Xiphophorus couchianus TaxID=32473 RepID=A0A3B5MLJ4_9TELE